MLITSLVKKQDLVQQQQLHSKLVKLNPYEEIWAGSKNSQNVDKKKLCSFSHEEDGRYFNINELPKNLVMKSMEYLSGPYSGDGTGSSMSPYPSSSLS